MIKSPGSQVPKLQGLGRSNISVCCNCAVSLVAHLRKYIPWVVLGSKIQSLGHSVTYITCEKYMPSCPEAIWKSLMLLYSVVLKVNSQNGIFYILANHMPFHQQYGCEWDQLSNELLLKFQHVYWGKYSCSDLSDWTG